MKVLSLEESQAVRRSQQANRGKVKAEKEAIASSYDKSMSMIQFYFYRSGSDLGTPSANQIVIESAFTRVGHYTTCLLCDRNYQHRPALLTDEVCDRIGKVLATSEDLPESWGIWHTA